MSCAYEYSRSILHSRMCTVGELKFLVNPRRACAGGLLLCVCLSVTTLAATSLVSTLKMRYVGVCRRLFSVFTRGFSINPSVQKLWREKANMQISMYVPRPVLAAFKYRACTSRYVKTEH